MHDFLQEPVAFSLRLVFMLWFAVGFWVLSINFLLTRINYYYAMPKWWKKLLLIYFVSIVLCFIVATSVAKKPEGVALGFAYGSFGLALITPIALVVVLIIRAIKNILK